MCHQFDSCNEIHGVGISFIVYHLCKWGSVLLLIGLLCENFQSTYQLFNYSGALARYVYGRLSVIRVVVRFFVLSSIWTGNHGGVVYRTFVVAIGLGGSTVVRIVIVLV